MMLLIPSDILVKLEETFPHFLRRMLFVALYVLTAYLLTHAWRNIMKRSSAAILEKGEKDSADFKGRVDTISIILRRTGYIVIYMTAFLMVLGEMGVAIGPLLTGLGILGVAVGFGAQYMIKDIISGFFIVAEDQFRVGELVKIDSFEGTVECITLRTTRLRSFGGQIHIIPNGEIRVLSNLSRDYIRAIVDVDLPFGTGQEKAASALGQAAAVLEADEDFSKLLLDKVEVQGVTQMGESGLRYRVSVKMKPDQGRLQAENTVRNAVLKALKENCIELSYPHRELTITERK